MRDTIKNIVRSVVFIAGLLLLLVLTSKVVIPKNNAKKEGIHDYRANGILTERKNSIDVLFIGDSESYAAFCPLQIWKEQGITSYVCGTSAQKLCYSEEFLHKAFDNQKPKLVILETNTLYREMAYNDSIHNKLDQVLPVFRYHNRWKKLKIKDLTLTAKYKHSEITKGYRLSVASVPAITTDYMTPSQEKELVSDRNIGYVESMKAFCEKNGAKLILVSTPSVKNWSSMRHNGVKKLANDLNLDYIDMNMMSGEIPIDWNVDTRDKGDHMNYYGAMKVSHYLGTYFAEQNIFKDKREQKSYKKWNKALTKFEKMVEDTISKE